MKLYQDHTCVGRNGTVVPFKPWKHIKKVDYSSTQPQFLSQLEVGAQFHDPAASSPEKDTALPID